MIDMMLTNRDPRILSELNIKSIASQIKKTNVETVTIWFKDENGFTYYPTEYGMMHPNLNGVDFAGEMVKELKKADIEVIAYYIVGLDQYYAQQHPQLKTFHISYQ